MRKINSRKIKLYNKLITTHNPGCRSVLRRPTPSAAVPSTLVVALPLSWLDYANCVLAGLPAHLTKHLLSVLNAAAHMIHGLRRFDHVSDALMTLHWLRIPERIQFRLAVLVHSVPHGNARRYLGPLLRASAV
jgi:hypothetical protein